jgi:hypothetical protein
MWVPSSRRTVSGVLAVPISFRAPCAPVPRGRAASPAGIHQAVAGWVTANSVSSSSDLDVAQLRLVREFVAEADAVVVDAEDHRQAALGALLLLDLDAQLAVVVAHVAALAPGLFPGVVMLADALSRS